MFKFEAAQVVQTDLQTSNRLVPSVSIIVIQLNIQFSVSILR